MIARDRVRLQEIARFARKAIELVGDRDAEALEADEDRLLALVGALILMGEGVAQLSAPLRESLPLVAWRQAKSLRNLLVHRYFEIKVEPLVSTVEHDLPRLVRDVEQALAEGGHDQ